MDVGIATASPSPALSLGKKPGLLSATERYSRVVVKEDSGLTCWIAGPDYQNADRAFRDVESALTAYNSIIPKMDTFTQDNGTTAVLLCLHGTVPITFRGATYNIPVAVWLPFTYPQHPPMAFVTPTATMLVRMSKHVDLAGKVYHPMLALWHTKVEDSNLVKLLATLQEVFSIEPPVYARPANSPAPGTTGNNPATPPPIPSKPAAPTTNATTNTPSAHSSPVPIPASHHHQHPRHPAASQAAQSRSPSSTPPPVPPNPYAVGKVGGSPSGGGRPLSPTLGVGGLSISPPRNMASSLPTSFAYGGATGQGGGGGGGSASASPHLSHGVPGSKLPASPQPPHQPPKVDPDEARARQLRLALRERVLQAEATRRARLAVDQERLVGIQRMLKEREARIRDVMRRLEEEKAKVKHSAEVLRGKNGEVREKVERLGREPEVPVDEMLQGGSDVYNQLYETVAEDHALDDTIYMLGQALNAEAIPLNVFMKHARTLARELFMKRVLVNKIKDHLA
ncbi:hypothetical protein HDU96_006341, partial [Phlyctochytrium bullatum]